MSLHLTRWLIELRDGHRPQGLFLHVFEDGVHAWSADKARALRFVDRCEAVLFARREVDRDFVASEHSAADLVGAEEPEISPEDEVDDLAM